LTRPLFGPKIGERKTSVVGVLTKSCPTAPT
jgi:hypothetical protein